MHQRGHSEKFSASAFSNHGCWCSNQNSHHGHPQSKLDKLCHQLHQCTKCVTMEYDCHSAASQFWLIKFNPQQANNFHCSDQYENCAQKSCGCAEHVLNKIADYLEENVEVQFMHQKCPSPVHHSGSFSGEAQVRSVNSPLDEGNAEPQNLSLDTNNPNVVEAIYNLPKNIVMKAANLMSNDKNEASNVLATNRGVWLLEENQENQENNIAQQDQSSYSSALHSDSSQANLFHTSYNPEIENVLRNQAGSSIHHNACCGEFPEWFPYEEGKDNRKCCSGRDVAHTYDSSLLKCCANGQTVSIHGECPEEVIEEEVTLKQVEESGLDVVVSLLSKDSTAAKSIPICNQLNELLVPDQINNWYKCQSKLTYQSENNSCKSTTQCQYATVPNCETNTKLVAYPMDECCNYYYCAPSYTDNNCETTQCHNIKNCGKYQVKTTNLDSFMDCCPETECLCDYNLCPNQPNCLENQVLVTRVSEDSCCNEYECLDL